MAASWTFSSALLKLLLSNRAQLITTLIPVWKGYRQDKEGTSRGIVKRGGEVLGLRMEGQWGPS